jgi:outer membrane protein OmpA-like peptidoglycan-associated protein
MFFLLGLAITEAESGIKNRAVFVGANVRALGMGSAFTAGPSSGDGLFWNPSSLGFLDGAELSLVGLPFADDAADREGAFSLALNPQAMGIADYPIGNFSVSSWFDGFRSDGEKNRMMLLGYGLPLNSEISAGANIRHHRWSRSIYTQLGWSFDLGLLYSRKLKRLGDRISLGLTFEDLGGHVWENGELVEKLPPVTRLGATYYLDADTIFSSDLVLRNDKQFDLQERFRTHIGAERWLFNRFGIRIGYTAIANYDRFTEGEWSRGFSLRNESGRIDYAYVSGDNLEQGVHWIAATLYWGGPAKHTLANEGTGGRGSEGTRERGSEFSSLTPITEGNAEGHSEPDYEVTPKATPNSEVQNPTTTPAPILMPEARLSTLTAAETVISPNGDGVKDEAVFDFDPPGTDQWQLELRDEYSEVVWSYTGAGLPGEAIRWNGLNAEGKLVSDGKYVAELIRIDSQGKRRPQSQTTITVDTMPAELKISAEPPILASSSHSASSGGEVVLSIPEIHVQVSDLTDITRWTLQFFDRTGKAIDQIQGDQKPPTTIVWNDWKNHRSYSDYRCMLTVYDTAGNASAATDEFSLVDFSARPQEKVVPLDSARDGTSSLEELSLTPVNSGATPQTPADFSAKPRTAETEAVQERKDERGIVLTLSGVAFASNSYEIKPEYRPALEKATRAIAAHPGAKVVIEGHTDDVGEAGYNLELSRKRANAVMTYLVENFGVSPSRLSAIGYGKERPIAPNDSESNQRKNRRVDIVLLTVEGAEPPASPHPNQAFANEATAAPGYTVLASSFKNRKNAETLVEALTLMNFGRDIRIVEVAVRSELWHRVLIGRFRTKGEAQALANRLKESQDVEPLVILETDGVE